MKKNGVNHRSNQSSQGKISFKPVIAFMDKLATRMNRLDKKMDSIRKETGEQFKASRKEMQQGIQGVRKEMKQEIQGARREIKEEIQTARKETAKHYFDARDENRIIADEHARTLTKTYTTMDAMAKDYSRWLIEKQYNDVELERHSRTIKELVEKDTEKNGLLQDLQKRVVALENVKNGKATLPQPVSKLEEQH